MKATNPNGHVVVPTTEDDFYAMRQQMLALAERCLRASARDHLLVAVLRLTKAQIDEHPGGACAAVINH